MVKLLFEPDSLNFWDVKPFPLNATFASEGAALLRRMKLSYLYVQSYKTHPVRLIHCLKYARCQVCMLKFD